MSAKLQSGSGVPPLNSEDTQRRDAASTIATSLSIEPEDFEYTPFGERGRLGKAHQLFGEQLPKLLDELNEVLAA